MNGYKTIIFNVLMGLVLIATQFAPDLHISTEQIQVATDGIVQLIAIVTVLGNLVLRHFTKSSIAYKK